MRRFALVAVAVAVTTAAAAALAVAVTGSADAAAKTSLTVTYWPDGPSSRSVKWTLRCVPTGGTLRRPARACAKLKAGGAKLFAPMPRRAICTEIYGGPQVARVVGKLGSAKVGAAFNRQNGCEIGRWDRLSPWLIPRGGVT